MEFIISFIFVILLMIALNIPYIIFIGILLLIIWAITTKKIASKTIKIVMIMVILLYAIVIIGTFKTETSDGKYKKFKQLNDNQSLIGVSAEEVIKVLGKPEKEYGEEKEKRYEYYGGKMTKKSYWGFLASSEYYEFYIAFDESGKVKSTLMRLIP